MIGEQVSQYTEEIGPIRELGLQGVYIYAITYKTTRSAADRINPENMSAGQGRVLGTVDIQELALSLLGQSHLINNSLENVTLNPIQVINERQIRMLGQLYRTAEIVCRAERINYRTWTSKGITGKEARVQANAQELSMLLIRLGQDRLRQSIRQEVASEFSDRQAYSPA